MRRLVYVSTADVYGPDHFARVTEKSALKPAHAYERLKLYAEEWLLETADDLDVVIVRPARVFGEGDDWILPRLMAAMVHGRVWLPGGGRAKQTFVSAEDVGRACLAASDRGRPGHRYLVGGFDSTWRDFLASAARAVGFAAAEHERLDAPVQHVLGKPHQYDDSYSRRELTWSPSVGSFEQEIPAMARWLTRLPVVAAVLAEQPASAGATSLRGR